MAIILIGRILFIEHQNATVKVITSVPPVSVMGLNVLQKDAMVDGFAVHLAACLFGTDDKELLPITLRTNLHRMKQEHHSERKLSLV